MSLLLTVAVVGVLFAAAYAAYRLRGALRTALDSAATLLAKAGGRIGAWLGAAAGWVAGLATRFRADRDQGPIRRFLLDAHPAERPPGLRRVLTAAVLTLLIAFAVLTELQDLLAGMHTPEDAAVGLDGLVAADPDAMDDAVCTWRRWEIARLGGEVTAACPPVAPGEADVPGRVLRLHVLVDSVLLVPAYVVVAAFALLVLRRRTSARWTRDPAAISAQMQPSPGLTEEVAERRRKAVMADSSSWGRLSMVFAWLLVLGAAFDLIENVLSAAVYGAVLDAGAQWTAGWPARLLRGANGLKTLLLAAVVGGIAYHALLGPVAARTARGETDGLSIRVGRVWRGILALRVPVIVVGLLAVLLLVPLGSFSEQFADVFRRWNVVHAAATLYVGLWLAVLLWVAGRTVARRIWGAAQKPPYDRTLRQAVVAVLLGAGAVQLVLRLPLGADAGSGLLIPAVLVIALAAAGLPLGSKYPRSEGTGRRRYIPNSMPRLLGAAVPVILGVAAIRAGVAELMLSDRAGQAWLLVLLPPVILVAVLRPAAAAMNRLRRLVSRTGFADSRWLLHWTVGSLVVAVALLALLRGTAWDYSSGVPRMTASSLVLVGIATVLYGGYAVYYVLHEPAGTASPLIVALSADDGPIARRYVLYAAAAAAYLIVAGWVVVEPFEIAPAFGTMAIILLFLVALLVLGFGLTEFAERTAPPRVLTWMGFRRTPMLLGFVAWIVAASLLPANGFHDVPAAAGTEVTGSIATPAAAAARADLADCMEQRGGTLDGSSIGIRAAFDRWLCRQDVAATTATGDRRAVPLVIVSAWGGGIRAAVWTALALDCVFEAETQAEAEACDTGAAPEGFERSDRFFAGSGISGGALGLLEYQAYLDQKLAGGPDPSWVRERLTGDYLAPTFGRMVFADFWLRLTVLTSAIDDRGDVLEQAWEKSWDDGPNWLRRGLFGSFFDNPHAPLVVSNGTSVNDECSFNGSVLVGAVTRDGRDDCESLVPFERPAPAATTVGTRDLASYLCPGRDVLLSTAALLSARFAIISPSGRMTVPEGCDPAEPPLDAFLIDGGYLENSGTVTAFQIWDAVEPLVRAHNSAGEGFCVVPVMIHLENGYSPPERSDSEAAPNEWLAPIGDYTGGLVSNARQRIALEFTGDLTTDDGRPLPVRNGTDDLGARFAFVTTRAHPGVTAPLGWTLSRSAVTDLEDQLSVNEAAFGTIDAWFSEDLNCGPAAP